MQPEQHLNARSTTTHAVSQTWRCHYCGRTFGHARWLAGHLMDVHGEPR